MRLSISMLAAALSLAASACGAGEDGEAVGAARQAQVDGGQRDYLIYTMTQNGTQIGQVLVTNTAGDGYAAGTEYWYMSANVSTRYPLTFTSGASQAWSTPPSGLGTLSFKMAQHPVWTSGTPSGSKFTYDDPFTGASRYLMDWGMTLSRGVWVGSITWWNTSSTGNVFGPSQSDTLDYGSSYSGTWYSYTADPI
jgi:hypothetical protein